MPLSYEQVLTVLQRLTARGEPPTLRAIRAELGTGSLGTIQKHLVRFREEQVSSSPFPLSRGLQEALQQEIKGIADRKTEALTREIALLKEEVQTLAEGNEAQEREIQTLRQQQKDCDNTLQQKIGQLSQYHQLLTEAQGREAAWQEKADALRGSLAAAELRLEEMVRLREELDKSRQECDRERQGRILAEKEAAVKEALLNSRSARDLS